ncbi:MAG: hypothetical protein IKZ08_02530 [Bacteroidales bacterium]|nr:hypothetical protein [Bacteroidales bacterium]
MRTTRYCDWVIHKKLREAKTVYVAFARGENKYRAALNRVRDLVSAGYDVRPMNQLQLYSALMAGSRSKYTLRDMDILTPEECYRADAFLSKCLGEWVHKEAERRIRPDGLIVGNNTTMGGDE